MKRLSTGLEEHVEGLKTRLLTWDDAVGSVTGVEFAVGVLDQIWHGNSGFLVFNFKN